MSAEALREGVALRANIRRRRHIDRQDDPDQCAAGGSGEDHRSRRHHRGHARAAMRRAQPRRHADQGWRRLLSDLVRSSLRLRPDRIPIGEVRGLGAAGPVEGMRSAIPGGVGTIHAGSAIGALRRIEQLIQEAVVTVPAR